jgi:hypothetical protein
MTPSPDLTRDDALDQLLKIATTVVLGDHHDQEQDNPGRTREAAS